MSVSDRPWKANWRRWPKRAAVALACLAALPGLGLVWFASAVPGAVEESERRTDAIVVLTGGSGRLRQGLALLAEGKADELLVSGVHPEVDLEQLLAPLPGAAESFTCCITLGYQASDTRGNALETAAWTRRHGFTSLRLVTAAYHMPRSLLEFRRVLPDAEIVPHPVFPAGFSGNWWRRPDSASVLLSEYAKFLAALVQGLLPAQADRALS